MVRKSLLPGRRAAALAFCATVGLSSTALSQPMEVAALDPDDLLRAMSEYLAALDAFTVEIEADTDYVDLDGRIVTVTGGGHIAILRPDRLYVTRQDYHADVAFVFDGTDLTLYRRDAQAYATAQGPETVDAAIDYVRSVWGIDASGADLLYSDVHGGLVTELRSSSYLGVTLVSGVPAHHLAFRARDVDWQIWIATGDAPVPLRYTIASKWIAGAPVFEIRLRDWDVTPEIDPAWFDFVAPPDAVEVDLTSEDAAAAFFGEVR